MPNNKTPLVVECPTCHSKVEWLEKNESRPFCSERCKNSDFIDWANEEHKISSNPDYDDFLSGDILPGEDS